MTREYYFFVSPLIVAMAILASTSPVGGIVILSLMGLVYLTIFIVWITRYIRDGIREHKEFLHQKQRSTERRIRAKEIGSLNSVYASWNPDRFNLFKQAIEAQKKENK